MTFGNEVLDLSAARKARTDSEELVDLSNDPTHPVGSLPFVRSRRPHGAGIDYWVVDHSTNYRASYRADCETGRALGKQYLAFIGEHPTNGNATLLACIVADMVKYVDHQGQLSGIERGFLWAVNEAAMTIAAVRAGRLG
jgi:hypothetical protein